MYATRNKRDDILSIKVVNARFKVIVKIFYEYIDISLKVVGAKERRERNYVDELILQIVSACMQVSSNLV